MKEGEKEMERRKGGREEEREIEREKSDNDMCWEKNYNRFR